MKYTSDILAVCGAASVTSGAALFSAPVAFIVAGGFMILGAWLLATANAATGAEKAN